MLSKYPVRNTVRIILLNDKDELLLMRIDDPRTRSINGKYKGYFWVMIGGRIENNETVKDAATRELLEETGINNKEVRFGPIVWHRELDLILYGKPTHIKEKYIVAITKKKKVSSTNLTQDETGIVKELKWFSLEQIVNTNESIYPIKLSNYLPYIIGRKYSNRPTKID